MTEDSSKLTVDGASGSLLRCKCSRPLGEDHYASCWLLRAGELTEEEKAHVDVFEGVGTV